MVKTQKADIFRQPFMNPNRSWPNFQHTSHLFQKKIPHLLPTKEPKRKQKPFVSKKKLKKSSLNSPHPLISKKKTSNQALFW